jgi:LysM repeat protein
MKILKIFGIVAGIHLFALVLIFANPGCSSSTKAKPSLADTAPKTADAPKIVLPAAEPIAAAPAPAAAPVPAPAGGGFADFNPDAPAAAPAGEAAPSVRFVPTRPGTPVAGTLKAEPVADVTPASTYAVKSGDSLWTIARKHGLTVAQLSAANNLAANAPLRPGQKLLIPSKAGAPVAAAPLPAAVPASEAPAPAKAAASARSGEGTRHTVKAGETLGAIARRYGVRQGEIAVANNISDPAKIRAGMELVIPGASASAARAPAAAAAAPKPAEVPALKIQPEPAPVAPPPVPVIRIDDSPITPAPKP